MKLSDLEGDEFEAFTFPAGALPRALIKTVSSLGQLEVLQPSTCIIYT